MNATFAPIAGISVEFIYDRQVLTSAIAAQVSTWISGIAFSFFGVCESTVDQGREARNKVNQKVLQVRAKVTERVAEISAEAQGLMNELAIATEKRMRRKLMGWVQPLVQEVMDWVGKKQNQITEVLDTYIAGAEEPLLLSAVSEEPGMLSAVDAAEEGTMVEDHALSIAEATANPVQDVVEGQSQVLQDRVGETSALGEDGSQSPALKNPKSRQRRKVTA